ncbi:MAG: hypothetical protein ACKPCM_09830, partial [Pseudanabaena sp.]
MLSKMLFRHLRLGVFGLLAITLASCGQPMGSTSSIKTEDKQIFQPTNQPQSIEPQPVQPKPIENKSEGGNFSRQEKPVAPIPRPNAQGDYTVSKRTLLHPLWQVVDPEGLNCRMPQQYHWQFLSDQKDRYSSIADELLQDNEHDPLQWPVMTLIKTGEIINAFGGNLGAMILLKDRQNKTWLPVA